MFKVFKSSLVIIFLLGSFIQVTANDEIFLQTDERKVLKVPNTLEKTLKNEEEHRDYYRKTDNSYFSTDEEVFESKAGKTFGKFVDNVLINNKLNQKCSEIEEKYIDNFMN